MSVCVVSEGPGSREGPGTKARGHDRVVGECQPASSKSLPRHCPELTTALCCCVWLSPSLCASLSGDRRPLRRPDGYDHEVAHAVCLSIRLRIAFAWELTLVSPTLPRAFHHAMRSEGATPGGACKEPRKTVVVPSASAPYQPQAPLPSMERSSSDMVSAYV